MILHRFFPLCQSCYLQDCHTPRDSYKAYFPTVSTT